MVVMMGITTERMIAMTEVIVLLLIGNYITTYIIIDTLFEIQNKLREGKTK